VDQVRATGRATMGVSLMDLAEVDSVVGVARSADLSEDEEVELVDPETPVESDDGVLVASTGVEPVDIGDDLTEDTATGNDEDE